MKKFTLLILSSPLFFSLTASATTNGAQLEAAIKDVNNGRIQNVQITDHIEYSQSLHPLNLRSDFSLAGIPILIEGNGHTLKATSDKARGFICFGENQSKPITIRNLTLDSSTAKGGEGQDGGGGGAGFGGGVFVGKGSHVVLDNVHFVNCQAIGGSSISSNEMGGGGGGGLGGDGGRGHTSSFGGGGGGGLYGKGGHAGSFSGGGGGGLLEDGCEGSKAQGGHGGNAVPAEASGLGGEIDTCGKHGSTGSGGGGCGRLDTSGGSGGNGGFGAGGGGDSFSGIGGKGGFGGGGAGGGHGYMNNFPGGDGNDGGFGGGGGAGGGNYYNSKGGLGGMGGYGGGGGAGGPNGGIGGLGIHGGRGANDGGLGGGGSAMGGAIFIEDGGHLIIKTNTSFTNSSLTAGSGFEQGSKSGKDIFMMSGGTIIFDLQSNVTVPSAIESDHGPSKEGGLIKHGLATLTLSGENTYTGKTDIKKGTLLINGSIQTPVELHGGSLGGQANVLATVNNPRGTVSNAYGDVHIAGDYTQGSDGVYYITLCHDDETPSLKIDGTAYLDGVLKIDSSTTPFKAGREFEILSANSGLVGEFSNIRMAYSPYGTPLFKLNYLANQLFLTSQPFNLISIESVKSGNPKKTLDYICSLFPLEPNSDLSLAVTALAFLSPEELNKALDQLNPALYGGLEWINLNQQAAIFSMVTSQLSTRACPPTGICKEKPNHIWFQPYGYWNQYGKLSEIRGFGSDEIGFALGYDRKIQDFYVGVLAGYSYTDLDYDQNAGGGNINSVFGGLYGKYISPFFLAVNTSVTLGGNFYDLSRKIQYGDGNLTRTIQRNAKSNHNALAFSAHLGLNYDFEQLSAPVGIHANLDYSYLNQNRFKESGADSLDLDIRDKVSNMLQTELGAYYLQTFTFSARCISPYLGLSWVVKVPLSDGTLLASLRGQGGTFKVDTTSQTLQFVVPKAAVKISTKKCLAFTLETYAELSGSYKSYFLGGRLEQRF